jgi:hypothetical protein
MMVGAALGASCGAMTLEPLPPDELLPEAAPPPRLVRRDAGPGKGADDEAR